MILDGRAIANDILEEVRAGSKDLSEPPSFLALAVDPSPATQSYLRMKKAQAERAGIRMLVRPLMHATEAELLDILARVEEDAVIVQLPLPDGMDTQRVLDAIPVDKDADVLSSAARKKGMLMHPVAAAIRAVLAEGDIDPNGKNAVVIGQGWLVGLPAAEWLRSAGASVTVVTKDSGDLAGKCRAADIIVAGAGVARLVTPDIVTHGATVIDIGTSELAGSIAGDVAPEVRDVAGVFTPVPGGVGPITVACLMRNVLELARRRLP